VGVAVGTSPGGLEQRGRPTAGLAGSDWLPPLLIPAREEVKAIAAARTRRLTEHLEARVRCVGGLHRIQLTGGRLRLLDHPPAERRWYAEAPVRPPRCIEILQAWRKVRAYDRDKWRQPVRSWQDCCQVILNDWGILPPPLAKARKQSAGEGQLRRRRPAAILDDLGVSQAFHRQAKLWVRLEYARVRPGLLLDIPPAALQVNFSESADPHRLGTWGMVWSEVVENEEFGRQQHGGWIELQVRRHWGETLLWEGLGVVDGRLVLDVRRDDPRLLALVIHWAGRTRWATDVTTVPGDTAAVEVPLLRDRAGRWHLADPAAGTSIRQVREDAR
jgi:hypothetical protein